MITEGKFIRDFIYVDVERLYSLYSQIFEGVTDQIVQSYMDAASSGDTNVRRGPESNEVSIQAQVAEMSRRTENKFLYDHMYNLFEERVSGTLLDVQGITGSNYLTALNRAFLVKIKGWAEVEDYNRLNVFMEKFNTIGEAIAYAGLGAEEGLKEAIETLEKNVEEIRDRNTKAKAKSMVGKQTDKKALAKKRAETLGLHQDEQALKNLNMFSEFFYPQGFDITLVPKSDSDAVAYRGVLDKRWLRIQPDLLRALYGGYVESEWTMVGQITYLPGVDLPKTETAITSSEPEESPSMRDPYRNMFRSARVIERMFLESKGRAEVVVCPIAIYKEAQLLSSTAPT